MKSNFTPVNLCFADSLKKQMETNEKYGVLPFYFGGKPLLHPDAPRWGMSVLKARSMRFRWDETNKNRIDFLSTLCSRSSLPVTPVSLELIHSKDVFVLENGCETDQKKGDGMITKNQNLLPVVTIADCMPIFLFDTKNEVFGVLHSGWKGTGIIESALETARKKFGTNVDDVCVVLGPHIQDCCYIVDEERAEYFTTNFTPDCVSPVTKESLSECIIPDWNTDGKKLFRLSLKKANMAVLEKYGVRGENTVVCSDCTCCTTPPVFGSFRRETASLSRDISLQERWRYFTVQAAFCGYL